MQDAEGKGYRAAFPLSEILPLAQWKQEVRPPWEEAIRNHSPSEHDQPTFCSLCCVLQSGKTLAERKTRLKSKSGCSGTQGRDTKTATSCCNPDSNALHIHLNFKYRAL